MGTRAATRTSTTTALTAAVVLGAAAPAAAHVTMVASSTAAGAVAVLTVTVPHGCAGSPTTAVTISVPGGVSSVTPKPSASWDVEPTAAASGAGGGTVVTFRATSPLPEGVQGELELQLQLPDAAGTTLAFPTVQTCEAGESAWTEVPAAGQDVAELQQPAPTITLTGGARAASAAPASGRATTPAAAATPPDPASGADDQPLRSAGSSGSGGTGLAVVAGAVGVLAAGALVLRRRRT